MEQLLPGAFLAARCHHAILQKLQKAMKPVQLLHTACNSLCKHTLPRDDKNYEIISDQRIGQHSSAFWNRLQDALAIERGDRSLFLGLRLLEIADLCGQPFEFSPGSCSSGRILR